MDIPVPVEPAAPVVVPSRCREELNSELVTAVYRQRTDDVRLLLRAGASPDAREASGSRKFLLHLASTTRRDSGILALLLAAGARLNAKDAEGRTALQCAVRAGTAWAVRQLLTAGAGEADRRGKKDGEPLREARRELQHQRIHRRAEVVRMLDKGQSSLSPKQEALLRQLMAAVSGGRQTDIRRLLKEGAPLNAICPQRLEAPLHLAVADGNMRVVRQLVEAGADINLPSAYGRTPLMRAMGKGRPFVVTALLKAGADPNQRDTKGRRALDYCSDGECRHILVCHGALRGKDGDEG